MGVGVVHVPAPEAQPLSRVSQPQCQEGPSYLALPGQLVPNKYLLNR